MAYSWRPIELRDPLGDAIGKFDNGLTWGRNERYEKDAPETFGKYLDSLGNATTSQALIPPGSGVTTNALVTGSHDATTAAQDPLLSAFFKNTRRSESGGNDAAKNPNSTATGRYQFLEGTWADLAQRHPELGLTPDGRTDPAQQEAAMRVFTQENAGTLGKSGLPVNPGTLYAAHFLGAGGAAKVLAGDPNSLVSAYVDPAVVQANPQLADMTVAQFAQWANEKGGNAGGGYQPPMAPQPQATVPAAGNGLPPREVMLELFRNPSTRPLAIELAKANQEGRPAKPIEINGQLVDPNSGQVIGDYRTQESNEGPAAPSGYRWGANGGLEFIPGGPADPAMKGADLTQAEQRNKQLATVIAPELATVEENWAALTDAGNQFAGTDVNGNRPGLALTSPEYQQAINSLSTIVASYLYSVSGATATDEEIKRQVNLLTPKIGESKKSADQKLARIKTYAQAVTAAAGNGAPAPAGADDPLGIR